MKSILSALTLGVAALSTSPLAIQQPVVHPLLQATVDVPESDGMNAFMNGITATCPTGMKLVDARHLLRPNMTYKETLNAVALLECHPDQH